MFQANTLKINVRAEFPPPPLPSLSESQMGNFAVTDAPHLRIPPGMAY